MRPSIFSLCLLLVSIAPVMSGAQDEMQKRVVKISVTAQEQDPRFPWQRESPHSRTGYGFLVDDTHVLTPESLVRNQRNIEVSMVRSAQKIEAELEISDEQVNLAVLRLPEGLFSFSLPMEIASSVDRDKPVHILQFDETLELQEGEGRVVQVDVSDLPRAGFPSLLFHVLTDLNVNDEGAPVLQDGKLCGIILSYSQRSRTGVMLPYPVLRRFLEDAQDEPYEGFATAGFVWKRLVDPIKRKYLNVKENGQGILVLSCLPGTGAAEQLQPQDVIITWDGKEIDNLGYYDDQEFGRLAFPYLIKGRREPGEEVPVTVIRNRQEVMLSVRLDRFDERGTLIPDNLTGKDVSFVVDGGLILRELTGRYLRSFGASWKTQLDPRLVHLYLTRQYDATQPFERVVILSDVLPDPINMSYQHFQNQVVVSVNGAAVHNMKDVFKCISDGGIQHLRLESMEIDLVLDAESLPEANERISQLYRIPSLRYDASARTRETGTRKE